VFELDCSARNSATSLMRALRWCTASMLGVVLFGAEHRPAPLALGALRLEKWQRATLSASVRSGAAVVHGVAGAT
jgi:hypothetical protein